MKHIFPFILGSILVAILLLSSNAYLTKDVKTGIVALYLLLALQTVRKKQSEDNNNNN